MSDIDRKVCTGKNQQTVVFCLQFWESVVCVSSSLYDTSFRTISACPAQATAGAALPAQPPLPPTLIFQSSIIRSVGLYQIHQYTVTR